MFFQITLGACWASFGFLKVSAQAVQVSAATQRCGYDLAGQALQLRLGRYAFSQKFQAEKPTFLVTFYSQSLEGEDATMQQIRKENYFRPTAKLTILLQDE